MDIEYLINILVRWHGWAFVGEERDTCIRLLICTELVQFKFHCITKVVTFKQWNNPRQRSTVKQNRCDLKWLTEWKIWLPKEKGIFKNTITVKNKLKAEMQFCFTHFSQERKDNMRGDSYAMIFYTCQLFLSQRYLRFVDLIIIMMGRWQKQWLSCKPSPPLHTHYVSMPTWILLFPSS